MTMDVKVDWQGARVKAAERVGAADGLFQAAEHVLEQATRLVPLDVGTLQDTGATDIDRAALRASVYYNTDYACRQHEELTWSHPNGRQAKYLEQPANSEKGKCATLIARAIARSLGGP